MNSLFLLFQLYCITNFVIRIPYFWCHLKKIRIYIIWYYICYIVGVIEKDMFSFLNKKKIRIVCYNINVYIYMKKLRYNSLGAFRMVLN